MSTTKFLLALAITGITGCLAVPGDDVEPMCHDTSDCDTANGEICADGVCWGDPPDVTYAARIAPPGNRSGLVATEITKIDIADNGWFTTSLRLEEPVTLSGTVNLVCPESTCPAIASTITVSRASRIPGGPAIVTTAHTTEDSNQFSIEVPRANADEVYSVVVAPDRANSHEISLDGVAPKRIILTPTDSVDDLAIGLGDGVRTITGTITDIGNAPFAGIHAVIRGQWEANGPMTDVSSIATTSAAGTFSLQLSDSNVEPDVELVLTPPGDLEVQPTVHVHFNINGTDTLNLTFPDVGNPRWISIPITGTSAMGVVEPVANAEVTLIAQTEPTGFPLSYDARVEISRITDSRGEVGMNIIAGPNLTYELRVQPPPQSGPAQYATIYGMPLDIGTGMDLPAVHLANQVAVHGTLYDHAGREVEGVVISVTPDPTYAATLSDQLQDRLAEAVATSESTQANGEFAVYVDPSIAGAPAVYDISFEPGPSSLLPSWQQRSIAVDPLVGYDVGDFDLPEAAYVRGTVFDPEDQEIEGAEVRLYEIPPEIAACPGLAGPPDPVCAQKAILRALATSDQGGSVHLVLPDP